MLHKSASWRIITAPHPLLWLRSLSNHGNLAWHRTELKLSGARRGSLSISLASALLPLSLKPELSFHSSLYFSEHKQIHTAGSRVKDCLYVSGHSWAINWSKNMIHFIYGLDDTDEHILTVNKYDQKAWFLPKIFVFFIIM